MNDLEPIKRKIYEIRGYKVMLDSDLAELYNVETKNLKRAVRANIERFPDDFMFELTKEEYESLRCKNFTLKSEENENALRCKNFTSNNRGGNRYLPFAFTREGIAMLSGLLRSEIAVKANINIMRAFFQMQEALLIVGAALGSFPFAAFCVIKAQPRNWRAGRRWGGRPRARTSALSGIRGSRLCRSLWGLPGTCTRDAARQRL